MSEERGFSQGWTTFVLLALMLLSVAWAIGAAEWAEGLSRLTWAVMGGLVTGWVLGKSRLPSPLAWLISLPIGVGWLSFVGSTLIPRRSWSERLLELATRMKAWLHIAITGGVSYDDLPFVVSLSLLLWVVSFLAAWYTFRHPKIWRVVIPGILILLTNLYYAPSPLAFYFFLYLMCAFLLLIRFNFLSQQMGWHRRGIRYGEDVELYFLRDGALLALVLLVVAWTFPRTIHGQILSEIWESFETPWHEVQEHWNRLFSLRYHRSKGGAPFFSLTLELGGPVHLGREPVMLVRATRGRYWRAVVYDTYTGRGWLNTDAHSAVLRPDDPSLPTPPYRLRLQVSQTFQLLQPGIRRIFAASQPLRIDVPVRAVLNVLSWEGQAEVFGELDSRRIREWGLEVEPSALQSLIPLRKGQRYTVVSSISVANEESLRTAGQDYPAWVTNRYLQLPPGLPSRVRELARELTADHHNPYDKAVAIESYLRTIPYNELISPPPPGRDAVDYFLFDIRQGYCDYYASAMAVLARAVGIPARIASGYTQGRYDPTLRAYQVREEHAHTWVEIYFPHYGWVEFEPTASEPPIVRPRRWEGGREERVPGMGLRRPEERQEKYGHVEAPPEEAGELGAVERRNRLLRWGAISGGGLALALASALWLVRRKRRASLSPVEWAYGEMVRQAHRLGLAWEEHLTPYEGAQLLSRAIPQAREQVWHIARLYVRERFAPRPLEREELERARETWRALRPLLWREWLRRMIRKRKPSL